MNFIHDDFLLDSPTSRQLYHGYAANQPILDYHTHLPPAAIAADRRFSDLCDIWLEGDHYKWRAMRANGIPERFCTGDAPPYEKFLAWASTVPHTLRNPLYHWTHLELKRYFRIDALLDRESAPSIWERAGAVLESGELTARTALRKFGVEIVCTTDDPCDELRFHRIVNQSQAGPRAYPTFRPDRALSVDDPTAFNNWIKRLEKASNIAIPSLKEFLDALQQRHDFFHANGARLSDHGLPYCYSAPCGERDALTIFQKARDGKAATPEEHEEFASYLMRFLARLDAEKGWTKQLHVGALRAVNGSRVRELGADSGFDAIGDWPQAQALCSYLDSLAREHALPKMIVYNVNPADNYVMATAIGSFQDESTAGRIQLGSGWWFLDQKEGIERRINALSNTGLLSRFVGTVTDSRSFMSFPRHEYFRRILCNLLGREVEEGTLPNDEALLGGLVKNLCFENACRYLGLELPPDTESGLVS